MTKSEVIELLADYYHYDKSELKKMNKDELLELWNELSDDSNLFPNGRDMDAENWDD